MQSCTNMITVAALLFLAGCSGAKPPVSAHPMGEKIQVGKLVYHVIEAEWRAEAPGAKNPPKNRILQVTMGVTNASEKDISFPLLRLIGPNQTEYREVAEIEDNPRWFGLLRTLSPSLTETRVIFFDAPVGAYKLEIVDVSDPDRETEAFIDIPASLAPPPVVPSKNGA